MGNFFLHNNLIKEHGKEYANEVRNFKYALMKYYGVSYRMRQRAMMWSMNHIKQIINNNFNEKVFTSK